MSLTHNHPTLSTLSLSDSLLLEVTTAMDDARSVFVTGNFNAWKERDDRYRMERMDGGKYRYVFPDSSVLPRPFEYKYIKGGWDDQELNSYGQPIPNRKMKHPQGIVKDFVPRWQQSMSYDSRFLPDIRIIDERFEIPQLIKTRRIAALLPHDYRKTDKRYPVLYLQDGQNLFEDSAPFGTWGVDKRLAQLAERRQHEVIIIAIDHAEEERIKEYTPSFSSRLGRGEGKKYARFLADTLKPFIDKHFRTLPGREHTGIGGSSMGGLISIYAGLMYPEVYSKLMIFSPSLWVTPNIRFHFMNLYAPHEMNIYLYAGGREGANMVRNIRHLHDVLEEQNGAAGRGNLKFKLEIDPVGTHNEARWGREFPHALRWLYFE